MSRSTAILAREGTIASVSAGARIRINPGFRDKDGVALEVDEAAVYGPFFVASYNGTTFDVQSIGAGASPLRWIATALHSDQHRDTQTLQTDEGDPPGAIPSPDPAIPVLGGGGGAPSVAGALESPDTYTCPAGAAVGDAVYISGAFLVGLARADVIGTMPCAGFISEKPTATTCKIIGVGFFTGFPGGTTPGAFYYVSKTTAGGVTTTPPTGPGIVQPVGIGYGNSVLNVLPGATITLI